MAKATALLDQTLDISERFRAESKIFEVEQGKKFPDGIKMSLVLIDTIEGSPRLLIDNH